jgi:hypothetical protein
MISCATDKVELDRICRQRSGNEEVQSVGDALHAPTECIASLLNLREHGRAITNLSHSHPFPHPPIRVTAYNSGNIHIIVHGYNKNIDLLSLILDPTILTPYP